MAFAIIGAMSRRWLPPPAVFAFLLPNFAGFVAFMLFPILFSVFMALTNWSLKPAVETEFLGLRNFTDLLGIRALEEGHGGLGVAYVVAAAVLAAGLAGSLWAVAANWRGAKIGGAVLTASGSVILGQRILSVVMGHLGGGVGAEAAGVALRPVGLEFPTGGGAGLIVAGAVFLLGGIAVMRREEGRWRFGVGSVPPILLAVGALALWMLHRPMWASYESTDARFWKFFYNTAYLMMRIPFAIAGSLALALLLNNALPLGRWRARAAGTLLCLVCGALTLLLVWSAGSPNIALLSGVFWLVVALGTAFNIVSYRTLFYLPTFCAGVALMILWKALYNPETGPINMGLETVFLGLGFAPETVEQWLPGWLADVSWSKPALIFMGIWTAIGGTNMLLYLAGLSNVPQTLLDAAEVDGAGFWARFRHVTWPQLAPTTFFISIMAVIGGLQGGFEQARVMTQGGPAGSTTTLSYYIYNKFFQDLDMGYAAAISWILFAVIFIATAINWRFGRQIEVVQ